VNDWSGRLGWVLPSWNTVTEYEVARLTGPGVSNHTSRIEHLADTPEAFAMRCVELLESPAERDRLSAAARRMVAERFSWESVAEQFERILRGAAAASAGLPR